MYPKEVRERAGRRVLIVQCKDCGQESEVTLPLIGPQVCTCGRTMLVDTDTVNIVAILEAKFRAQRAGPPSAN